MLKLLNESSPSHQYHYYTEPEDILSPPELECCVIIPDPVNLHVQQNTLCISAVRSKSFHTKRYKLDG
jgi:hypothetical protein